MLNTQNVCLRVYLPYVPYHRITAYLADAIFKKLFTRIHEPQQNINLMVYGFLYEVCYLQLA